MKHVTIYTDGACRGNPGPGGWGVVLLYRGNEKLLSGATSETTNNRMELTAAIEALNSLKEPCRVDLYTDSQYLQKGIKEWVDQWKRREWRRADKSPVKNADLWKALDASATKHDVSWHWVKGHSGHPENDKADSLANEAIDKLLQGDEGCEGDKSF